MKQVVQVLPLLLLSILAVFLSQGRVRFGHGLGDIVYHGVGYLGLLIYSVYFLWTRKNKTQKINLMFPVLSNVFCAYLILSMTIWRGHEYRWNGDVLAPSMKTRKERKQNKLDEILAQSKLQTKILEIEKLKITVEIIPEGEDLYYITWEDTIGMKSKYGLLNRPLELWCHIQNLKLDTVGYYRGLSMPSSFTYFETKDSIVTFEFSKAFNFFNEAFFDEKEREVFWEKNKIPIRFEPIEMNLKSQLRQKVEVELVKK